MEYIPERLVQGLQITPVFSGAVATKLLSLAPGEKMQNAGNCIIYLLPNDNVLS